MMRKFQKRIKIMHHLSLVLSVILAQLLAYGFAAGANQAFLIKDLENKSRQGFEVKLIGQKLVVVLGGNIRTNPPIRVRALAFDLAQSNQLKLNSEIKLTPGSVNSIEVLSDNSSVAIGIPDAMSTETTGKDRSSTDAEVSGTGTAPWSKQRAVAYAGRIIILSLNEGGIRQTGSLSSPSPKKWSKFGISMGAKSGWLAVGEPGGAIGHVYLFKRSGSGYELISTITAKNTENFGYALAFSGKHLVVGSPGNACCKGVAVFYEISETGKQRKISTVRNPFSGTDINYGRVVRASENRLLIGGHGVDLGDGIPFSGGLDVYEIADKRTKHLGRLDPGNVKREDGFGAEKSATISSTRAAVIHRKKVILFEHKAHSPVVAMIKFATSIFKHGPSRIAIDKNKIALAAPAYKDQKYLGWYVIVRNLP